MAYHSMQSSGSGNRDGLTTQQKVMGGCALAVLLLGGWLMIRGMRGYAGNSGIVIPPSPEAKQELDATHADIAALQAMSDDQYAAELAKRKAAMENAQRSQDPAAATDAINAYERASEVTRPQANGIN